MRAEGRRWDLYEDPRGLPMEAAEERRESKPPKEVMEHVDCLLEPRLDTGEGVSSIGTLLLALAMEEFCGDGRRWSTRLSASTPLLVTTNTWV